VLEVQHLASDTAFNCGNTFALLFPVVRAVFFPRELALLFGESGLNVVYLTRFAKYYDNGLQSNSE